MEWTEVIDTYCLAWSESDAGTREKLLHSVFATDATYTDPGVHLVGPDALLAHIARVIGLRPGATVRRTTGVDAHHDVACFGWCVQDASGRQVFEGVDFAEFSGDTLTRIVGFFGTLPPR